MSRKNRREHLVPELTPLIDVVFLLLIFFMVSSVFKKEELALLLNLPKAEAGKADETPKNFITIELSKDSMAYEGVKLELSELQNRVESIDKKSLVNLRVDGEVHSFCNDVAKMNKQSFGKDHPVLDGTLDDGSFFLLYIWSFCRCRIFKGSSSV